MKTDREYRAFSFSDGTYSTIGMVAMGKGQVCVFGGDFCSEQINDIAVCISSGLTYRSMIVSFIEETFKGSDSGRIPLTGPYDGLSVFVSIGKYHCAYAERFDL